MYGNVGTDERLDFTVIGRPVNQAARLQGLTKHLGEPVLASAEFARPVRKRFIYRGAHPVPRFDEPWRFIAPAAAAPSPRGVARVGSGRLPAP